MSKRYRVILLPGDGIGPEVVSEARLVMKDAAAALEFDVDFESFPVGGSAIDRLGSPLPDDVLEACLKADAVLLGAVGGPRWDHLTGDMRPESGLLKLRKSLGTFANLRPVLVPAALADCSPLRPDTVKDTDLLVVRELTGGIYFGVPRGRTGEGPGEEAFNTMRYTAREIERVASVAFEAAQKRSRKVTSVDKANVLVVSQLWRDVVTRVHESYPDVALEHMYVDNAAMQLVLDPRQFDVILTSNLFGDILSDVSATLGGSLGLLPSASIGGTAGLFEPVHGSAPAIAGRGKANPIAAILSAAMLLEHLGETVASGLIRGAVHDAIGRGVRTADLARRNETAISTSDMGALIRLCMRRKINAAVEA